MGENKHGYDVNDKWDACLDLGIRRFFYSSFAGAASALILFRTPATRWASIAFGAGLGIGSAYTECSIKFDGASKKPCLCPLCHRQITLLVPTESSSQQRHDPEVSEILRKVQIYNRTFGQRSDGLIQVIISTIYIVSPVDIIPEGVLGVVGLLDDFIIALICFLHVAALYRSVLVFRHGGS